MTNRPTTVTDAEGPAAPDADARLARARQGRNTVLAASLAALAILTFVVTMVKMQGMVP
ncbi:hypothetical protein [Rhodothalassium salexigens]|uniref:hypothetical protein n=1 Tax=Rhodothalassium salexigens TaxID=1086 RepID=UPI00191344A6|nr:hypothetical protein [Rhodothalassium salexigens]